MCIINKYIPSFNTYFTREKITNNNKYITKLKCENWNNIFSKPKPYCLKGLKWIMIKVCTINAKWIGWTYLLINLYIPKRITRYFSLSSQQETFNLSFYMYITISKTTIDHRLNATFLCFYIPSSPIKFLLLIQQ